MAGAGGGVRLVERRPDVGVVGLVLASLLVGVAIALDGAAARAINGLGGLLWIGAGVVLVVAPRAGRDRSRVVAAAVGTALILALWARPFDLVSAVPGFLAAGALVGWIARERRVKAALLVPALWLPVHLVVAIGKAILRAATDGAAAVRTDPPPTAAVVPLGMVVAAAFGGLVVVWWRERGRGERAEKRMPSLKRGADAGLKTSR